jgi:hypothetical protein
MVIDGSALFVGKEIAMKTMCMIAALLVAGCAVEQAGDDLARPPALDPAGDSIQAPELEGVAHEGVRVIAKVARPNGGLVHFLASETGDGVGCGELVPADGSAIPASSGSDPRDCLQLFVGLTATDVPVPEALVASSGLADAAALVAGRRIVKQIDGTLGSIEPARSLDLVSFTGTHGGGPHSCEGSDGSQSHFEAVHCDHSGGSGVIEYCDSGQWYDLYRATAGAKRATSFEEVLVCNTNVDMIHEYWNGTSWWDVYEITNIPGSYWYWSRWEGTFEMQRRIHVFRVFPQGFFRSHSIFYN